MEERIKEYLVYFLAKQKKYKRFLSLRSTGLRSTKDCLTTKV